MRLCYEERLPHKRPHFRQLYVIDRRGKNAKLDNNLRLPFCFPAVFRMVKFMNQALSRLSLTLFLFLALVFVTAAPSQAAPLQPPAVERADGKAGGIVPVAEEIKQQIQALVTGDETLEIEPQETFGTRMLGLVLSFFNMVRTEGLAFAANFAAIPQLESWFRQQTSDSKLSEFWKQTGEISFLAIAVALLAGWLADLFLFPLRRRIRQLRPESAGAKFGALAGWLLLSLVPVIMFIGAALVILEQSGPAKPARFFVMTLVYALAILRLVRLVIRFFMASKAPHLRFLPLTTPQAKYAQSWLYAFSAVMVVGFFGVDLARFARMPAEAVNAFSSIIGLAMVIMAIVVILQKRAFVSAFLRGELSAAQRGLTLWQYLRLWLARIWHVLAIAYLVIGYAVTMLGSKGGFAIMQRGTVLTLIVLFSMRLAFYWISRLKPRRSGEDGSGSPGLFWPVAGFIIRVAVWAVGAAAIAVAWGADIGAIVYSPWGQRILGSVFTIGATVTLVVLVYEFLHAAIERRLNPRDAQGQIIEANARARTLLPMARNAAMVVLAVMAGMVTLSELGIDTTPLLAGAGILGVALGFGSQTLVKDFLTGLFIILEDTIAVGDVVTIGEHRGVVEGITIRTVRLRDLEGALHVIPFSAIAGFINRTKGFSYALMTLGVAYDSDIPKVLEVMRSVGEDLRVDPAYGDMILEPIEIFGVENLADFSINVSCRIKTAPGKHWEVKRAYLQRVKQRFDEERIQIPFPTVTHLKG